MGWDGVGCDGVGWGAAAARMMYGVWCMVYGVWVEERGGAVV